MNRLARQFKVGTLVLSRRLHDAGHLTRKQLWDAYDAEVQRLQGLPRGKGSDYYLTTGAHVKIPNVCLGLKIRYLNPFDMLRRERARFVLAPRT